ncbi:MAG: glutaredoxin family protein [Pyrinomonadaceae bacterium]
MTSNLSKPVVTIYTRPRCHLCEEAKQSMCDAQCADEYTLNEVNIEGDPDLLKRYRYDVPVISINGVETFKHRVTPEDFRTAILHHSP